MTNLADRVLDCFPAGNLAIGALLRLLDSLHEDQRDVSDRAVDSHIKNLRRKLEQAGTGDAGISSVYGVGYRFDET